MLLSQHHEVVVVDIVPVKAEGLHRGILPIADANTTRKDFTAESVLKRNPQAVGGGPALTTSAPVPCRA